jgi:hypothetical protein
MITALIDRKNMVIMDWSAKAGATVLTKMFFNHMGILDEALEYSSWIHWYRTNIFWKKNPTTMDDLKNPSYFKFKVVRNPYSRVVSDYITTMMSERLNPLVGEILDKDLDISFREFIGCLSRSDLTNCYLHHRPQKKDYECELHSVFNYIARLETINDDIEKINKIAGTNYSLKGITSDHHVVRKNEIKENMSSTPWSKVKDNIPPYRFFYTPGLVKAVERCYKVDIEAYSYSFEDFLECK